MENQDLGTIWAHLELNMATIRQRKNKSWQAVIRRKGYPKQSKTFLKQSEAICWARAVEREFDQGRYINFIRADRVTLNEIIDSYVANYHFKKDPNFKREYSRLKTLKHHLGSYVLSRITSSKVALFRDLRLAEGLSAGTVVKDINTLSKLLKMAKNEWNIYLSDNPIVDLIKPKLGPHRVRRLTSVEEEILISKSTYQMQAVIIFAIETAMRLGEILSLKWSDIHDYVALLKQTKNGDIRYVPLNKKVITVLQRQPRDIVDNRVFYHWKSVSGFESSWQKFKRTENLIDLRFHDLRHEAISRMFEKGLNHMEVSSISGHKSLLMLRRYSHYQYAFLRQKLN